MNVAERRSSSTPAPRKSSKVAQATLELRRLQEENRELLGCLQADLDDDNLESKDLDPQQRWALLKQQLEQEDFACRKVLRQLQRQQSAILAMRHGRSRNLQDLISESASFLEALPDSFAHAQRARIAKQRIWQSLSMVLQDVATALQRSGLPAEQQDKMIVRRHESMDREYHFVEMDMPEEKAIEEFGMKTQLTSLPRDHPQWKVFLLRTPAHQSAVLMHLHHALGDGLGLLFATSPLMGVQEGHPLANIPLPRAILPPFARKPEDATPKRRDSTAHRGFFANCCCGFFRGVRNFMRGFFVMLATSYDSDLPMNAPLTQRRPRLKFSGKRRLTRLPTVPLSTVKRARENHEVTLNDIVMAAVTGAIRRYCVHKGDTQLTEGRPVECKSMLMLALPRECDISNPTIALQNKMLFSSVRLPVQEGTRAGRVKKMAEACSDLKSMAYMMGLKFFTNLASMSPRAFLNKATGESWSKHSFLITNVPSTTGPMTWPKGEGGEQLQGITMVIANVMNQVSVISYNGELYSSLVSDPDVIDEEAEFCKIWLSEFEALADPMKNDTDGVVRP